jgi:RNA polymerase sigma-70 factor (ECF subfamily)
MIRFTQQHDVDQVLHHLDAAYNLARWLVHSDGDAQHLVQEALVGATRWIDEHSYERARTWLLLSVRQACLAWLKNNSLADRVVPDGIDGARDEMAVTPVDEPLATAWRKPGRAHINAAIAGLPVAYREILVLRDLEDLPYADIALITDASIGIVLSRLAHGRGLLKAALGRPAMADHRQPRSSLRQSG